MSLVRAHNPSMNINDSVSEALDLIDFKLDHEVKSVAIKPNLAYYWNAATGYTTDPKVTGAVIDFVRERFSDAVDIKVVEADASAMRTKHAFPVLGYEKLAREKDIELLNLSKDELVEEAVHVDGHEIKFMVSKFLLKTDFFVNIPKLKIMRATKITCAMKNIFGTIGYARKLKYHPVLNEAIVGINKILRPDLTVVDGLVALGRYPIKLGLIMASVDPFSIDWVASQIMGYNPSKVKFLRIAIQEKLGDPTGILTKGEDIAVFKKDFPKANFAYSKYSQDIMFFLLKSYSKIVGDVVPPVIEEA